MDRPRPSLVDQLRGATRLAVVATLSVTDIVEQMHHTIGGGPAVLGRPFEGAVRLLTAPTYGAIRGVTRGVGAGLDAALAALGGALDQAGAERGPVLAALNGVIGDYLEETGNPLAIPMRLCKDGAPLALDPDALEDAFPVADPEHSARGDRLVVLVHGSSMEDRQWRRGGHDHGAALAADRGVVPIYLRYNSGLHISQNGARLAALLERLFAAWPRPVVDLTLLGHSMGGLVSRSAIHVAEAEGQAWRSKLSALVTLGTPHHGAPLERGGSWIDTLLGVSRYSAPLVRLGQLRSAGVTDLRYGNVADAHWQGRDRFARGGDPRGALALPAGVTCVAIAASLSSTAGPALASDGLVPVDSALGRHADPQLELDFGEARRWVALGANHLDLLSRADVYAKLLELLP